MRTRRTIQLGAVSTCLVAVGCGSGSTSTSSSEGGSGGSGGGSCKAYIACNLLPVSQVNQALGTSLAMGVESDEVNGGGLPTTFVCEYGYAEGTPNAGLFLGCSAMGVKNGPDVYQGYEDVLGGVNTPVSGLGAFAFWHTRLPDAGPLDGGSLTVYFGDYDHFTIFVTLPDVTTIDAKAVAVQMAMTVLGKV